MNNINIIDEFQVILSNLPDSILILDKEGEIVFANDSCTKLFKRSINDLKKHPFGFPVVANELQEILIIAEGKKINVQMLGNIIKWGEEEAFMISLIDITEKKQLENALYRSYQDSVNASELTRQIIDSSVEVILVLDQKLDILTVNKKFEDLIGKKRDSIIGKYLFEINPAAKFTTQHDCLLRALKGEVVHLSRRPSIERSDLHVDTHFFPLRFENEIKGVIVMSRDVTDIFKREEDLLSKNIKLQDSNNGLEAIAYIASNDLQKPLNKIRTIVDRMPELCRKENNTEKENSLHDISGSIIAMQDTINYLLSYINQSPIEGGKESADLHEILELAIQKTGNENDKARIELVYSDLPEIFVNKSQFILLFHSLFQYSIKYTNLATPSVKVTWKESSINKKSSIEIIYEIRDKNCEPKSDPELLGFSSNPVTDQPEDCIELSICERIIKNHKGKVRVKYFSENLTVVNVNIPKQEVS